MNSSSATYPGLASPLVRVPAPADHVRPAAFQVREQTGSLSFARSNTPGVASSARIGDLGLASSTTKLKVGLDLKAGQKYSFSFHFSSGGPQVTLLDSRGKGTAVNMASGFTVKKSGRYQLQFEAGYSLKDRASFDNLAIQARSVLPTSSGDRRVDALVMGDTNNWWHNFDSVAAKGKNFVSPTAVGLAPGSSATALTYSFLAEPPAGHSMNNFQAMTNDQKAAVRNAFAHFGKLINVTFTEASQPGAGNINLGANTQSGSAGYAYLPNASGVKDKTFVFLANNVGSNHGTGLQEGGRGYTTLIHEIGHALGLKHPGNYNAGGGGTPGPYLSSGEDHQANTMMSYHDSNATRGANVSTPMLYDVAALQYLYGANTSASTATSGNFTFSPNQQHLKTLWSTNGTDTINLTQLQNSSHVDLNAGSFSSVNVVGAASSTVYSGNKNVALAFGSKIDRVALSSTAGVKESVTLNNAFQRGSYNRITSFDAIDDRINFKSSMFKKVTAANIEFGTSATKSTSRIVVNRSTGDIFFDPDGKGKKAAVRIAQYTAVSGRGEVSASNFSFVA